MEILEAAAALGVVMLALSTIVTMIVEVFLRVLRIRKKGMEIIVEHMFDEVVWPRLKNYAAEHASNAGEKVEEVRQRYKETILGTHIKSYTGPLQKEGKPRFFGRNTSPEKMTATEFLEKLADTEIADVIRARGKKQVDILLREFVQKFESVSKDATNLFRERSGTWSTVIGIALAFVLNANVFLFFDTFLKDEALRAKVVAERDVIMAKAVEEQGKLAEILNEPRQVGDEKPNASEVDEVNAQLEELNSSVSDLKTLLGPGISLSYQSDQFPACLWSKQETDKKEKGADSADSQKKVDPKPESPSGEKKNAETGSDHTIKAEDNAENNAAAPDAANPKKATNGKDENTCQYAGFDASGEPNIKLGRYIVGWRPAILWFASMLVSGILIGLGSPFWYDFVRKITSTLQMARGKGGKPEAPATGDTAAGEPVAEPPAPATPVEAFKIVSEARPKNVVPVRLLSATGELLGGEKA